MTTRDIKDILDFRDEGSHVVVKTGQAPGPVTTRRVTKAQWRSLVMHEVLRLRITPEDLWLYKERNEQA
ncbi:MAG TPA: hypothetical protein VGG75_13775 [Trebonia sp.]